MTSMEVDGAGTSSARRRRERRLRSWWRHERMSVVAALVEAQHHSAPKVGAETHYALRRQKTASAGSRPGVLKDPAPQGAVTVGYVAAMGPLLAVPLLASTAGEAVDNAALSFLLQQSLAAQKEEEEEVLEAARRQLLSLLAVPPPLRTAEQLSRIQDCNGVIKRIRKMKKRKKKKLPRAPRPRCGRPCARQRQVPAVRPSDSVRRRFLDIPVVQQRQVPTVHTLLVQFLGKVDVPVVVQRQVRGSMLQKTVVCPQLQFAGLLHPCRGAEADLHGPDYSSDHRGPTSGKTSSGRSSIMMLVRERVLRLNSITWRSSLQSSIIAWAVWHVVNYAVLGSDSQAIRGLYAAGPRQWIHVWRQFTSTSVRTWHADIIFWEILPEKFPYSALLGLTVNTWLRQSTRL